MCPLIHINDSGLFIITGTLNELKMKKIFIAGVLLVLAFTAFAGNTEENKSKQINQSNWRLENNY